MTEPRKTPFYEKHVQLKGTIVDYGGWYLPVQYAGIVTEVHQTRKKAGIFDVSHMGEVMVEGPGAFDFLQKVVTNDLSSLTDGRIIYSPVCYPNGGTVDDILIYRYNRDKYLLVVNAGNTDKDIAWFEENAGKAVSLKNISAQTAQIALQGPNSLLIMRSLTGQPLEKLRYYHFIPEVKVAGIKCIVSRTGYTGEDGFEIYCSPQDAGAVWEAIWSAGQTGDLGLTPVGLGARDVLRLEASMPLYGHELGPKISPLQAGLERFISFSKKPPFTGRDALLEQKEAGLKKKLTGLALLERGVLREGYRVVDGEEDMGWVSSGTYSPTLEKSVGMAFLPPDQAVGSEVRVIIRNRAFRAQVVKLPFYRRG